MVAWFAKASLSHSVDCGLRRAVDRIPLGMMYQSSNVTIQIVGRRTAVNPVLGNFLSQITFSKIVALIV